MKNLVVGSVVFLLVTLGICSGFGDKSPRRAGNCEFDNSSFNFVTVVFNVFEHLLDIEEGGNSSHASLPAGTGSTTVPWT